MILLTTALAVLKLAGVVEWSWWWVVAPVLGELFVMTIMTWLFFQHLLP